MKTPSYVEFKNDGSVVLQIEDVPSTIWKKFSDAMKHLGYEYRGAQDALELMRKRSKDGKTAILKGEHAKGFAAALGKVDFFKPKSNKSIIQKAVKEFGITIDPKMAGYIIPDGRMLNFGAYGIRSKDHREIATILPEDWRTPNSSGFDAIKKFCELGNIRIIMGSSIGLDIFKTPTSGQIQTIEDILFNHSKYTVVIDFPGHQKEFNSVSDPEIVIDYIKNKTKYASLKVIPMTSLSEAMKRFAQKILIADASGELMKIWKSLSTGRPLVEAQKMFPEQPEGYIQAAKDIGNWASNTATYLKNTDVILKYKPIADRIYNQLPDYARNYVDGIRKRLGLR